MAFCSAYGTYGLGPYGAQYGLDRNTSQFGQGGGQGQALSMFLTAPASGSGACGGMGMSMGGQGGTPGHFYPIGSMPPALRSYSSMQSITDADPSESQRLEPEGHVTNEVFVEEEEKKDEPKDDLEDKDEFAIVSEIVPASRQARMTTASSLDQPRALGLPYNLNSWSKVRTLPPDVRSFLRSFLPLDKNLIFISRYDRVFAIGKNDKGLLGLSEDKTYLKPEEIRELRCEQVVVIVAGEQHALALTQAGKMWQWGRGEVADGFEVTRTPKLVISDTKVTSVKAGRVHCMALNVLGLVFTWGGNACGQLGINDHLGRKVPVLVDTLKQHFIVQIAAGAHHSLALTEEGRAFAWGSNDRGQLGDNLNREDRMVPVEIELFEQPETSQNKMSFKAIAAGNGFTVLLTSKACVYQLGEDGVQLVRLDEQVESIYVHPINNLVVAKLETSKKIVYWGVSDDGETKLDEPQSFDSKLVSDVFSLCASPAQTPFMLEKSFSQSMLPNGMEIPILDKHGDFSFLLDNRSIDVHREYLCMTSHYFKRMFTTEWKKLAQVDLGGQNYEVWHNFLRFFYEGSISISLEAAIQLLTLSCENGEKQLTLAVIDEINRHLSPDTAARFFELSVTYSQAEWEEQLSIFIALNKSQVAQSSSFQAMAPEKAKQLLSFLVNQCDVHYNKL